MTNRKFCATNLPIGWTLKKIGQLADVTAGGTPNTNVAAYWNGSIPWMNSGEVNSVIVTNVKGRITQLGLQNSSTKIIPAYSVLMALAGQGKTRGKVAINTIDLCTNQSLAAIMPKGNLYYKFLFYNLESRYEEIRAMSSGDGGRGGLNLSIIKSIEILLPPVSEQQKIVELLSAVDEKMAIIDAQLVLTQSLKAGLMQRLLSRGIANFDFKDSALGSIPASWKVSKIGDVLELINGKAFKPEDWRKEGLPIIRIQNLNNSDAPFNYYSGDIEKKYYVNDSDILFAWSGTKGVSFGARIWKGGLGVLNQHIFRVVPNPDKLDLGFAFILLKVAQAEIESKAHGFKSSFVHVKKSDIKKQSIILPPIDEQRQIADILITIEDKINVLLSKKLQYQTLKSGLMQQLLTGQQRIHVGHELEALSI